MREVQRQRAILTDAEIATLFACERVSVEIRILVLAARTAGGARTIDLTVWDWTMIDIDAFAWCIIARTKTKKPQKLEIPNVLRGPLRAWWETHGSPSSGPVFPATKGPRAGKARRLRGTTFAHRLRRALLVAGITRHELHHDTEWSRRVDFHSCRRAFATALAEQHVDPRTAMALTGHSDPKVHERYVLLTQATRVPEAALPRLPADAAALIRPGIVRTAGAANENAEQRRASGACSVSSRS
jgi:integrase